MKIWNEVLGTQTVGESDDFFELGGDSLNAALFASLVKKNWRLIYLSPKYSIILVLATWSTGYIKINQSKWQIRKKIRFEFWKTTLL